MNGFVAYYASAAEDAGLAELGEVVVPGFCVGEGPCSHFIGLETFRPSPGAMVVDLGDADLDKLMKDFVNQYPGLPPGMMENHLVSMLACASKLREGVLLSTEVTTDKATVLDMKMQKQYVVWEGEDPTKY